MLVALGDPLVASGDPLVAAGDPLINNKKCKCAKSGTAITRKIIVFKIILDYIHICAKVLVSGDRVIE